MLEDTQKGESYEDLPEDIRLEQILMTHIGRQFPKPHMLVREQAHSEVTYETEVDISSSYF